MNFWLQQSCDWAWHAAFYRRISALYEGTTTFTPSDELRRLIDRYEASTVEAEVGAVSCDMYRRRHIRAELRKLDEVLATVGFTLEGLLAQCQELVLFGTRASEMAGEKSDWDLLCIGYGKRRKTKLVDLCWVTPEEASTEEWLGGELATHVARYGFWIKGEGYWKSRSRVSEACIAWKRRRLAARLRVLWRRDLINHPRVWQKYVTAFRLNLVRHWMLCRGEPVPPRPVVENLWYDRANDPLFLVELCQAAELPLLRALVVAGLDHEEFLQARELTGRI